MTDLPGGHGSQCFCNSDGRDDGHEDRTTGHHKLFDDLPSFLAGRGRVKWRQRINRPLLVGIGRHKHERTARGLAIDCVYTFLRYLSTNRRIKLSQSFFKKILSTNSCLHTLLPSERNNEVLSKLRKPLKYPVPNSRTKRHQPFLNTPWPTSKTANECVLFFFLCCELCIV